MPSRKIKQTKKEGFTIIEVVLVLAIAGLIFLMVFIALPALQRNQRDTQRRNDVERAITAIQNYETNNTGKIPDFTASFINSYLKTGGDSFTDPAGDDYKFYESVTIDTNGNATYGTEGIAKCDGTTSEGTACNQQVQSANFQAGKILAVSNAKCDGEKAVYASGARRVAILMKLEGAGTVCMAN